MKANELISRETFDELTQKCGEHLVKLSKAENIDYDDVYMMVKLLINSYNNVITPTIKNVDDENETSEE